MNWTRTRSNSVSPPPARNGRRTSRRKRGVSRHSASGSGTTSSRASTPRSATCPIGARAGNRSDEVGGQSLKSFKNEAGGKSWVLVEGDSLDKVPKSHRDIITPHVREVFADPAGHFR